MLEYLKYVEKKPFIYQPVKRSCFGRSLSDQNKRETNTLVLMVFNSLRSTNMIGEKRAGC